MPKVGDKHFAYTEKGKKKAKSEAVKTGEKVEYKDGGKVSKKKKKSSSEVREGYVVARGSGAARPQYFKVNT